MPDEALDTARNTTAAGSVPAPRALVVAGWLTAVEALAFAGVSAWTVTEIARGRVTNVSRAWAEAGTMLVFAVLLALLARWLGRGSAAAKTPTVVWSALLLPATVTMAQGGQWALAAAVAVLAVGSIAAVALAPREP